MIYTLADASSLINLGKSGFFQEVIEMPTRKFLVGPLVLEEVYAGEAGVDLVEDATRKGIVLQLDDSLIDADRYIELLGTYGLGEGETECIAYSEKLGYSILTDDRKARLVICDLLGRDRLAGSLALLREAVSQKTMSGSDAYNGYIAMRRAGAFLPVLHREYFDDTSVKEEH